MAVATREEVKAPTFKVAGPIGPDYHLMLRTVNYNPDPAYAISGEDLDVDVRAWLDKGFKILAIHHVGDARGAGGEFRGFQMAYHFVKQ